MMNRVERLTRAPQDKKAWQNWYYKTQKDYLRKRLKALAYLWEGHTLEEACVPWGIQLATLRRWVDQYLHGGFECLLQPITHEQPQRLSPHRKKLVGFILTHHAPVEYGFDTYVWTEPCVRSLIEQKWQIALGKSRVYEILDELNLSHQRARREYVKGAPKARKTLVRDIKKH
jgi:transposase